MKLERLLPRLLLLLISSAVAFFFAELAFRAYEARFLAAVPQRGESAYDLAGLGYNDTRVPAKKPEGEFRVLSFGDSFTWSIVDFEHSWNGVLERGLSALEPREGTVRVVNLGVADRSFESYVEQARFWTEQLDHDAVIFQIYAGNDFADTVGARRVHRTLLGDTVSARFERAREHTGPASLAEAGPGSRIPRRTGSRMLDYAIAFVWTLRTGADSPPEYLDTTQVPWDQYVVAMSVASHSYWDRALSRDFVAPGYHKAVELLALADRLREKGVNVVVVVSPPALYFQPDTEAAVEDLGVPIDQLDPRLPGATLAFLASAHGIEVPILDLMECLSAHPDRAHLYFGTNTHWGELGNRVVGEMLAARLAMDWFETTGRPGGACRPASVESPSPASALGRYAARVQSAAGQARHGEQLLMSLRGQRWESAEALAERLRDQGAERARPGRLEGRVTSVRARSSMADEPPSLISGWVLDHDAEEGPALVFAMAGGRVVGWGSSYGPPPAAANAPAGASQFQVPVIVPCDALGADRTLMIFGIGPSGRFERLELSPPLRCETT